MSVTRVDTNKGSEENPEIRCRRGARHFRSADNLFAPTPQWEVEAADVACGGQFFARPGQVLLIVVKKHLNSECTEDVSVELTEEVGAAQDKDGKFRRWLHRFRPSKASEAHYANKREDVGL